MVFCLWYDGLDLKMENHKGFIVLVDISGYTNFVSGHNIDSSKNDKLVIKAFQRRFLQNKVDGKIDQKTLEISHYLANK